jgi:hypothetical protein
MKKTCAKAWVFLFLIRGKNLFLRDKGILLRLFIFILNKKFIGSPFSVGS